MRIFYKQMHYCGENTCMIPAKLQVKAWQLGRFASSVARYKNWLQFYPLKISGIFTIRVREEENHCVSLKASLSLQLARSEFLSHYPQ